MSSVIYLAWRYLAHHPVKTTILVLSIMLIVYLPVGLRVLVNQSEDELTTRAEATPLVIGAKGSPLELVLNSLYFESDVPTPMRHAEVIRVAESGKALAIPLYTRFRARTHPIVGTSLDYFAFRGLRVVEGRNLAVLGECVVGAGVAESADVGPGDAIISSPENVFDLAGVYPLKMKVVGVLERSHTPDDRVIFVDLKTAWVIEGLGHGHQDLSKPEASSQVLRREGNTYVGNAAVVQYNEITEDNIESFHFHGDTGEFPVTAVIVVPDDDKSSAILQGRYVSQDEVVQIVEPTGVMKELLATILTVQSYVVAAVVVIGLSTLATAVLVFLLSLRLRRREIATMMKIGGSKSYVIGILASEILVVVTAAVVFAGGLTFLTAKFGSAIIRALILS
ncbi:MAG: ABC transporter permease [Candidatus Latescibacterota bacterium]|nr:MAG: ABC transporter permease [Candidatus Latescibacterota bacterium]